MSSPVKRWLAVGTAAAIALFGLGPASTAEAAGLSSAATNAATYLTNHLPKTKDGFDKTYQAALGLAATQDCSYSQGARSLKSTLESLTASYVKSSGPKAAKAAIAAEALGADPTDFAGKNLISVITGSVGTDGLVGGANGFAQALAIVALARADVAVPAAMVTKLLSFQAGNGGFAFTTTGDPDPDTTAVAILALHAVGGHSAQVSAATAWADTAQADDGSWAATYDGTEFSPVDSTGLLGSAVDAVGGSSGNALSWLKGQQLSSGAFSNVRNGSSANLMATAEAMYLLTGNTLLTATLDLGACPYPLPASTSSCSGVWVVVYREAGDVSVGCAKSYTTGMDALASAGFTAGTDGGFLNRINGFPETIDSTWTNWWGYYHATPNADGTWGAWTSYEVGASQSSPVKGEAELWNYGTNPWGETPSVQSPPKGYASIVTPTISGKAKVGKRLTAIRGSWQPTPGKYTYRWYRNGSSIKGATAKTYRLKKADKGKRISVKVTASGTGLQTVSVMSAKTRKVTK